MLRYDPLKVYVNDEGLVRFATELYSDSVDTLQSRRSVTCGVGRRRMMHLTNYSVNKQPGTQPLERTSDSFDEEPSLCSKPGWTR